MYIPTGELRKQLTRSSAEPRPAKGKITLVFGGECIGVRYTMVMKALLSSSHDSCAGGCGAVITGLVLDKGYYPTPNGKATHLRPVTTLYGKAANGKRVLMTADHIVPKAQGGKNNHKNLQVMCSRCNCTKSDKLPSEVILTRGWWDKLYLINAKKETANLPLLT